MTKLLLILLVFIINPIIGLLFVGLAVMTAMCAAPFKLVFFLARHKPVPIRTEDR